MTVINLASVDAPEGINVTVRGLSPIGLEMRQGLKISSGRWFEPGKREVVVGQVDRASDIPARHSASSITFGRGDWEVVGVMDAGQSAQNSEIFGDLNQVSSDLDRTEVLSSALVRATDAGRRRGAGEQHQRRSAPEHERGVREGILRTSKRVGRADRISRNFRMPSSWRSAAVSRP